MDTAKILRSIWMVVFSFLIIWGYLPCDTGISHFQEIVRQYVRLKTDLEFTILAGFIVPFFVAGFGWYSRELFADFFSRQR